MDCTISWAYIVNRMQSRYGLSPDNEERLSFGEIERFLNDIWLEFVDIKYAEEFEGVTNKYENTKL